MTNQSPHKQRGVYTELLTVENKDALMQMSVSGPPADLVIEKNPVQIYPRAKAVTKRTAPLMQADAEASAEPSGTEERKEKGGKKRAQYYYSKQRTGVADIDPKVQEPYVTIPGNPPRKVVIDRLKKLYASMAIEELLEEQGVDFSSTEPSEASWLPLEPYDDNTYDCRLSDEWIECGKLSGLQNSIPGLGLYHDKDKKINEWRKVLINSYNRDLNVYEGEWDDTKEKCRLPRLSLLFDAEDKRLFARRLAAAHRMRAYADALIKYNYFVDNMPTDDLPEPDSEQQNRILAMAVPKKELAPDVNPIMGEIKLEYARTMNKIIYDKLTAINDPNLIHYPLTLPTDESSKRPVKYYGMLQIEDNKFADNLSQFFFNTLLIKKEVIEALVDVRKKGLKIKNYNVFNVELNKIFRVDEFKQLQESNISQYSSLLKENWVNKLKNIIKKHFGGVGKGWFNIQETSKETYEFGKLKKLLTRIRLMMEESVLEIAKQSLYSFVNGIVALIPKYTTVNGPGDVQNSFSESPVEDDQRAEGQPEGPGPLFTIDLIIKQGHDLPKYGPEPSSIPKAVLDIFDKGISELQSISQLEPKVLEGLFKKQTQLLLKAPIRPKTKPDPNMNPDKMVDENTWVWDLYALLEKELQRAIEPLQAYLKTYEAYKTLTSLNPDEVIQGTGSTGEKGEAEKDLKKEIQDIKKEINAYIEKEEKIKKEIPESIVVSIFRINCKDVRKLYEGKYSEIVKGLTNLIVKKCRKQADTLSIKFDKMKEKISKDPKNIEELILIKREMEALPQKIEDEKKNIEVLMEIYDIIEEFSYKLSKEEMDLRWNVFMRPKALKALMDSRKGYLDKKKEVFLQAMEEDQKNFLESIQEHANTVAMLSQYNNVTDYVKNSEIVKSIDQRLKECIDKAREYNNNESILDKETTDYNTQIKKIKAEFAPYYDLWTSAEIWLNKSKDWFSGLWGNMNANEVDNVFNERFKIVSLTLRFFKEKAQGPNVPKMISICDTLKKSLEDFRPLLPVIQAIRHEGMKERHWKEISAKMGKTVDPKDKEGDMFSLKKLVDLGILNYQEFYEEIGEKATREYKIELNLEKIEREWRDVVLPIGAPPNNAKALIVLSFEKPLQTLDDHMLLIQSMQSSIFKGPFKDKIDEWNTKLSRMTDVIGEWQTLQVGWRYLQPIFDSPDIIQQLPNEASRFKGVDNIWTSLMKQTAESPSVITQCTKEGLFEKLQSATTNLEFIKKSLASYLEEKRCRFARFYFLADDDLLRILSQTKEVTEVQRYLMKVFENIAALSFTPEKIITAMYSSEKEKIDFVQTIDPTKTTVEYWMQDVEKMMMASVKNELLKAIVGYKKKPRTEWCLQHPGQCVLTGSQIHWTHEAETHIKKYGPKGPEKHLKLLDEQLKDTVKLVSRKLIYMQEVTMNALIVLDVHAKDVIQNMAELQVGDLNDFEWMKQLRFYWENKECIVKCVQTIFSYGYEYIGNQSRLVITPLTDKCFITLMGALKLNLGGAPAGPAGTGKTESVKDLAKGVAKQCVVFNCSEGLNFNDMAKFFKGLASSGAWCCFDEFNRINVEVLSVIAQQLKDLFSAKDLHLTEITFEGSTIKLRDQFSVYITMNPGYAGRTELPDNLKALFRPMAMMVPDYSLIARIRLYSFGFQTADSLAKKMVSTFRLSSEQLSSQDHYDYGMRAVSTVINAAGMLRREDKTMNEDQLLLRALRDVNVPKFLKIDLPLFENIIKDLFPGVLRPERDYGNLMNSIKTSCAHFNVQPIDGFLDKVIQLYDTMNVRHGLMLVGPTGGGKTTTYHVLAKALTDLCDNTKFFQIEYHVLNPKSVTMGQLYGEVDSNTQEWVEGIMAMTVENCADDLSEKRHWVIADGPVDSLWIENMNSVLDDNKKLCLTNGKIIKLSERMNMIFEVEDLAVASPATVSRCGMVYEEPSIIGNEALFKSWLNKIDEKLAAVPGFKQKLITMYATFIDEIITWHRKNLKELVLTVDNNIVCSLFRIIDSFFINFIETESKKITKEDRDQLLQALPEIFVFSTIWSLGATTTLEGRKEFDQKIRAMATKASITLPPDDMIYDYKFDPKTKLWTNWLKTIKPYELKPSLENYLDILVPTIDSIRMIEVLKMLVSCKKNVLTPGPTGTGKSVNINNLIGSGALGEDFQTFAMLFSAQTTSNQAQDSIDEKMSRRRRGIYGADGGKKFVIFVDDLNMPKKEKFGAQPPVELMRQYLDHMGWYDLKEKKKPFRKIEDMVFLAAMGPPGGGRQPITQRLQRHFNIISYTFQQEETIRHIFSTILTTFMTVGKYPMPVKDAIPKIMEMTLRTFASVLKQLLPMPSKSHYTFNLRDISKIFLGLCSAYIKSTNEDIDLIRLWVHENKRVFGDRLISSADREILETLLLSEVKKTFGYERDKVYYVERLMYSDFLLGIDQDVRHYMPVKDLKDYQKLLDRVLEDYNSLGSSKRQMRIIMFLDACEHVSRICRVLRQPQGHALLLGVGGSGRQSLSKLSIYIANHKQFSIEITKTYGIKNWREDLKKSVLKPAGIEEKRISFLFTDTQIISESALEDINNIINSGDVPGIYAKDDKEEIERIGQAECQKRKMPLTQMNKWTMYFNRVKKNIHIILAMSPLSEEFRNRLRQFPSLVSCCTINWFTEWPAEALLGVAQSNLTEKNLALGESMDGVVEMFKYIHQSVEAKSLKYLQIMRRHNYVTPTSFLEFLTLYSDILRKKRKENEMKQARLKKGIDVLNDAKVKIEILQTTLNKQRPVLEKTKEDIKVTKKEIEKQTEEANKKKILVKNAQESAAQQEASVSVLQAEAQKKLAEAEPILEQAFTVLKKLQVSDFYVIKAFPHPKSEVIKVAEMMCVIFEIPPKSDKKTAEDQLGFFAAMKTADCLLGNPNKMKEAIFKYDKDHIKESIVKRIVGVLNSPDLTSERVESVSTALKGLYMWLDAMMKYHENLKLVTPLRIKVAEIQSQLNKVRIELEAFARELADIDEKLRNLEAEKLRKEKEEADLTTNINLCEKRLDNSKKLLSGLENEAGRWSLTIASLKEEYQYLIADALDSAGVVAYAGVFTAEYRRSLETEWIGKLDELKLKRSKDLTMMKILKDDVRIREWNVAELPSDSLSIENAIIAFEGRRWPLMIDPQTQANKFIKKFGSREEGNLLTFKASDSGIVKQLETAIEGGQWVLLENIGEKLDPALEPLLQLQRIRKGEAKQVQFGDKSLSYADGFDFFLTTTLPNPHYQPEISVRVTLLNFAITPAGLEEQLLGLLVAQEMPEMQEKKNRLVTQNAQALKDLQTIEDNILSALTRNTDFDQLIDDEGLINELGTSQAKATEIKKKREESEKTEKQIDEKRQQYKPVAERASLLFFCITDLSNVDNMYQYALQWYNNLFTYGVEYSQKANNTEVRIKNIITYFTESLYDNICRSLFERHKLLFSFMLCMKILFGEKKADPSVWRYLLAGATGDIPKRDNPWPWMRNDEWDYIYRQFKGAADTLPNFKGIDQALFTYSAAFKEIFDSKDPHKMSLPGEFATKLNDFDRLVVIKALRSDKITEAVQEFIKAHMGDKFIEYPTFNITDSYKDSREMTPLIFILSSGSDPMGDWEKFADLKGVVKTKRESVSLGQGQEKKADDMIHKGKENGMWVLLQNCHFAKSWMPKLEQIVESLGDAHRDFRLWLTSMPADYFPVSVLQTSVKMTIEPPSGIRANLMRTFSNMETNEIAKTIAPKKFQKLLYGFAFFHAIVQDRRKFGPIGWNIQYEFNNEDFKVCIRQLEHFIDQYPEVPFKDLQFLAGEINYGGRVTDDKDSRLIKVVVEDFINPLIFQDSYAFSASGLYKAPPYSDKEALVKFTTELPQNPSPEVFGMHDNAEILTAQATTRELIESILNIQPREVSGLGKTREQIILDIVTFVENNTPKLFEIDEISKQYQIQYTESMNTVLIQELIRYNKLLIVMFDTMRQIKKALKGEEVMSEELEKMERSLFNGQVPEVWAEKGFLSLKPLMSWIKDLNDRIVFLRSWITNGTPKVFWISGFFFPQAFLTGTLQNYARRHQIAIDKLSFQFIIHDDKEPEMIKEKPQDGCFVYGMSFEGARWNLSTHFLDDSTPKELYTQVPMMHFVPMSDRKPPTSGVYFCPVYKVLTRRGTLSTTGHSTNFVIFMEIPTDVHERKWIKAGVAGFLALRY